MTSFMALDGVTSFLCLKDVTITCKCMRHSLRIGGSSSVQWWKVGRIWRLRMCFRRLLCVRIEIDQLQCVNCWVIMHCLSVSCMTINHLRCALVIWSTLQLTSKQWIITQQFTAGADLFLKSYYDDDDDEACTFSWNPYLESYLYTPYSTSIFILLIWRISVFSLYSQTCCCGHLY